MLAVMNGLFYTTPLPPDVERSIRGDWQYLLIEGMRRLDEAAAERGERRRGTALAPPHALEPAAAAEPFEPAARTTEPPAPEAPFSRARPAQQPGATVTLSRSTVGSMLRGAARGEATRPRAPR